MVRCLKHVQVLTCLVHACCGSLLPSTVSNMFALVTHIHIGGCALVSQRSPGVLPTSLPVHLLQDCQHLSVGAHVHLVRFRAVSHHVWLLPCINILHTSHICEGHQGKECCLLWAKNTAFWPKITYDIQQLIEKCTICQEYGKSQPLRGATQELAPFPWHTLATDLFYWNRMDFLIVADVFSKYILVRKLPNSSSAAVCIELSMIVTELGLPHIIKSDNNPCYNSKEFQQFLQCYSITHQTSSPNHPRSNGFVEKIVGVAKKLMDKAGKEGKPWISSLFDYRVTRQSGSIASPLQLITQHTPREKNLPQLPSAPEMHQTYQEPIIRQGNKPEREYKELLLGTPV